MKTQILKADGTAEDATPRRGDCFELSEMQKIVGGWIQIIDIPDGRIMVLNEEGKIMNPPLPVNAQATALAREYLLPGDVVNGDVLVCRPEQVQ